MTSRGVLYGALAAALLAGIAAGYATLRRAPRSLATASAADAGPSVTIAYAGGAELCFRSAGPSGLGEARCKKAGANIEQMLWIDETRVAARLEGGVIEVLEGGSFRALSIPPASFWQRPPPRDDAGKIALGAEPSERMHLFVDEGALWLARCPWWFLFDAGYCHEWVMARILPEPFMTRSNLAIPRGFKEEPFDLPNGDVPTDVTIEVQNPSEGDTITVTCRRGAERSVSTFEKQGAHTTVEWGWIGESPSSYVVLLNRDYGEAERTETHWMEACRKEPVRELGRMLSGPEQLWIHDDPRGWIVRWGARELGVLESPHVAFAPR